VSKDSDLNSARSIAPEGGAIESQSLQRWSIDQLVDDHFDFLGRYAHRYFRATEVVEDLVQETFLAATEAIHRFEGKSAPRTWLVGIPRHKIMDRLRRTSFEDMIDIESFDRELLPKLFDQVEHWRRETGPLLWGSNPDQLLEQKEFLRSVESCLRRLPEHIRQIFCLREVEGYDREYICDQFGLTSTNVGVTLHRARLSMQSCLQKTWFHARRGVS